MPDPQDTAVVGSDTGELSPSGVDAMGSAAPLWSPSPERAGATAMAAFADEFAPGGDLHAATVERADEFWETAFDRAVQHGQRGDGPVRRPMPRPPGESFFEGARVCYAEELLAGGDRPGASDVAIIYRREDGHREQVTWDVLAAHAQLAAERLAGLGVAPGDRVAAWLPNAPEAVIAMLATNLLGGVFTSASPDFGPAALVDRFAQVEPVVLLVPDAYVYAGKVHQRLPLLPDILAALPTVRAVVVVPELAGSGEVAESAARLERDIPPSDMAIVPWPVLADVPAGGAAIRAVRRGYEDPGFILYSSGTTGRPKCIVHSALGLLVKHWSEQVLHSDIRPGDVVFYYTTCGWMMWNWLVGALATGATVVLYDGAPLSPDPDALWRLAEAERVTFFGASAKFFDTCRKSDLRPGLDHGLPALRTVASTGSPLSPEDFAWIYDEVAADVHLASISGGTDICGCFVLGDPTAPVRAGEIQGPALGVAVDVVDDAGRSLAGLPGKRGDLVCRNRFPSMPLGFWGDADGSRYTAAYFDAHEGVWTHGDFAEWTPAGGVVISGRSDATLNAGGVRIGTAEIYRQVEHFDEVVEAMAVGQEHDGDTRVVLFLVLRPGAVLDDDLLSRIRARLRSHASPRHVPAVTIAVPDLPRTRSGKLAEIAVGDVINGRQVRNSHALANPEALATFADLPALR